MTVRTSTWPIEALPFEEMLTPVVESFLDIEEREAFDCSRSGIDQLYERVDELLGPMPRKDALLALIRNQLGEFDCLAICNSGCRGPLLAPGATCGRPLSEDIVSLPIRLEPIYLGRFRSILQGLNY